MKNHFRGNSIKRREFLKKGIIGTGLVLGQPIYGQTDNLSKPRTNIGDVLGIAKLPLSLPGPHPGKVVEVHDNGALMDKGFNRDVIADMLKTGLKTLSGDDIDSTFNLLFKTTDIVGIKVNPVGAGLISTRPEIVAGVIDWLIAGGIPKQNIIIWDRFDYMLAEAGFTSEIFPGIKIEGLQTMDESSASGESDDKSLWLRPDGRHISSENFDADVYYFADVEAPKTDAYLNQHVFNGKKSYFGKLLTQKINKIINIPVFKNSGNGISMATKNLGYGAICNTGRLHEPLFFDVCTEVLAFPPIRDKLVLNITDGLRCQYDGGPGPNAQFTYFDNRLYFATDPFALDQFCHDRIVRKRETMGIKVNKHPRYTAYLRYAEKLGLGITTRDKITHVKMEA